MAPRFFSLSLLSLALASLAGCAGSDLALRVGDVRQDLATARSKGAYRCAPRELALGESNVEFAEREFDRGEYFAARTIWSPRKLRPKRRCAYLRTSAVARSRNRWLVRIAPNPCPIR